MISEPGKPEFSPAGLTEAQTITHRADIPQWVVPAAVPVCERLYDYNIRTISSSAGDERADGTREAYVVVEYMSLSEENREVAKRVGTDAAILDHNTNSIRGMKIATPLKGTESEDQIARKLLKRCKDFQPQPLLWAPTFTLAELQVAWEGKASPDGLTQNDFISEGYYYNPETNRFHLSQELFEKRQQGTRQLPRSSKGFLDRLLKRQTQPDSGAEVYIKGRRNNS